MLTYISFNIMRRIFVDSIADDFVEITAGEHKHLSVVLRARKGESLSLSCGDGFVYGGVIEKIEKDRTVIKITAKTADISEPRISCDLFLSMIKGEHLEIAVQKAVELGVSNIYPVISKNAVKTGANLERLNKIALEAAKQSGRGRRPSVFAPQKIEDAYDKLRQYDAVVFPYEKADKTGIKDFLASIQKAKKIAVTIGPEGGLTADEAEKLSQITAPVSLGRRILRADTAAIAVITAVMYAFDEMSSENKISGEAE